MGGTCLEVSAPKTCEQRRYSVGAALACSYAGQLIERCVWPVSEWVLKDLTLLRPGIPRLVASPRSQATAQGFCGAGPDGRGLDGGLDVHARLQTCAQRPVRRERRAYHGLPAPAQHAKHCATPPPAAAKGANSARRAQRSGRRERGSRPVEDAFDGVAAAAPAFAAAA